MITYFEQAIELLLGPEFFTQYLWAEQFMNVAILVFAVIILVASFKLFKYLIFGWWH